MGVIDFGFELTLRFSSEVNLSNCHSDAPSKSCVLDSFFKKKLIGINRNDNDHEITMVM
ncbi:hypothetical protein ES703_22714 [subsurface metagenome]